MKGKLHRFPGPSPPSANVAQGVDGAVVLTVVVSAVVVGSQTVPVKNEFNDKDNCLNIPNKC